MPCCGVDTMDVAVRQLRSQMASVVAAMQAGTQVTLTVHGHPVADIVSQPCQKGAPCSGGRLPEP